MARKAKKTVNGGLHVFDENPTFQYINELQRAFEYFNKELWEDKLPPCLITFQRKNGAAGYFSPERFQHTVDKDVRVHEIAMNPDTFDGGARKVLATLVHEMCHHWQECFGKPGRGKYHNAEWAKEMKEVGLQPVCAKGTGKETGDAMTHEIIKDGPFDVAVGAWVEGGGRGISWKSAPQPPKEKKGGSRTKYVCPDCEGAVWGKADMNVMCGDCEVHMEGQE